MNRADCVRQPVRWLIRTLFAATSLCVPAVACAANAPPATSPQPVVPVSGHLIDGSGNRVANARVGIFRNVNPDNAPCPRSVPPEGCREHLFSIGADRAHAVATEDGRFTLQVPGGLVQYADAFWAEGVDSRGVRVRTFWQVDASINLPGKLDGIVLEQVADFVAVIRHEGQPLAGAQVQFLFSEPQRTDETGSATVRRDITPRQNVVEPVYLMVRAAGLATEYRDGVLKPGTTTLTIDMERESVLTGRILDRGGRPVTRATVSAMALPRPEWFPFFAGTARTDASGKFSLHGLGAGRHYRLIIQSDEPSVAGGERLITAGNGPFDFALNDAVPVTLRISGLHGPFMADPPRRVAMPKGPAVIQRNVWADANRKLFEWALGAQPDLIPVAGVSNGPSPAILMDWLDPDTGEWLPVFSPRHVEVRNATQADLRFDQVPVGKIRIHVTGSLQVVPQVLDPVTVRPGRRVVIPLPVTTLRKLQVKVVDRNSGLVSDARVELVGADGKVIRPSGSDSDGTLHYQTDPRREMSVRVIREDQVIATRTVPPGRARYEPLVVSIQL